MNKTAVIGLGSAGLMASSLLGSEAFSLEHMESAGKKLLITGGGKCNFTTHDETDVLVKRYYDKKNFVSPSLYAFPPRKIIKYLEELGVKAETEGNKVFPQSRKAEDVRDALLRKCGPVYYNEKIAAIEKKDGLFHIATEKNSFTSRFLVIATGGITFKETGSDGSITPILKAFGHTIVPMKGVLSEIFIDSSPLSGAMGISIPLTLKKGKAEASGDAVITRGGISGPVAENFSHYIDNGDVITLKFLDLKRESFSSLSGNALLKNALPIPPRLLQVLLPTIADKRISDLTNKDKEIIITELSEKSIRVSINGKKSMCTKGGVSTKEIDRKTMQSRIVENLYFAGEAVDVDGECGGCNITWAFSSAYNASMNILKKKKAVLS